MRGINKDRKEERNMLEDLSWGGHNPKHIPKNSPRQSIIYVEGVSKDEFNGGHKTLVYQDKLS
jgi:hypothetical protein